MPKKILKIFIFCLFFLLLSRSVFSQEKTSADYYLELLSNYRQYQNLIGPFNVKKSRHLTYNTVSTQAELLDISKQLILAEIQAITSYSNFIKSYLAETTQVLKYKENYLYIKLDDELGFLNLAIDKANSLTSIGDIKQFLNELETHYQNIGRIGYQVKSLVEIESIKKVFENLTIEKEKINNFLSSEATGSSKLYAAKEKFSSLEKEVREVSDSLQEADNILKQIGSVDSKSTDKRVRELITPALEKMSKIITFYKNIVFTLK